MEFDIPIILIEGVVVYSLVARLAFLCCVFPFRLIALSLVYTAVNAFHAHY